MDITNLSIYKPNFMAHYYNIELKGALKIQTDNKPYLGEEPVFVHENECYPMEKTGDYYSVEVYPNERNYKYHIYYKDTGKTDLKDGKDYEINYKKLCQTISLVSRNKCRQPLIDTYKEGKTVGRLILSEKYTGKISDISEPFILVAEDSYRCPEGNPNMVGYIETSECLKDYSMGGLQKLYYPDVCTFIYDPAIIDRLEDLHGEKIEFEARKDFVRFNKTDKPAKPIDFKKVEISKLKPCDKILTSEEFTPDVIGAKAVNLRKLELLKEQGKIDVIIPKSIGLPHGYIQNLCDNNPEQEEIYLKNKDRYYCKEHATLRYSGEYAKERMNELRKALRDNGIKSKKIIVRSAFSGGDTPDYPDASLYDYTVAFLNSENEELNNKNLYSALDSVSRSKWVLNAVSSRKRHQIPEENIQVGIIIQDYIEPAYKVTVNTNTDDGKLKVELKNCYYDRTISDSFPSHVFSYDKNSGKISYDSIQMNSSNVIFNEDGEIIQDISIDEDFSENKKIFEQVEKIAKNAIVVEKEFGHPQIIDGCIKDDDIYFLQTKNTVD